MMPLFWLRGWAVRRVGRAKVRWNSFRSHIVVDGWSVESCSVVGLFVSEEEARQ